MIPRLPPAPPAPPLLAEFLKALCDTGFTGEVSESDADRITFATDNSIYQQPPRAIVFPRTTADVGLVLALMATPRFHEVVLAPRGGGTGTAGHSLTAGIVLDLSRHMTKVLEIDPQGGWARVQAGAVKDQLNAALKPHGLFFAPELSTSNRATIGGMINTDACGQGSCLYGKTRDHVVELTSVLLGGDAWISRPLANDELAEVQGRSDRIGEIHRVVDAIERDHHEQIAARFPKLNRCLTGYDLAHIRDEQGRFNLNSILCGAEGTLAVLVEAKLKLTPIPEHSALVNLRYESFDAALRDVAAATAFGAASVETVDSTVLALARNDMVWEGVRDFFPGQPDGINLVEFIGDSEAEVEAKLAPLVAQGETGGRRGCTVARGEAAVKRVWDMRKRAVGLLGNVQGDKRPIPFVEDVAVPPENLADFIVEFRRILDERGLAYGMFGHVDAGVLHVRPAVDMKDPAQEPLIRDITDRVAALAERHGGLLWGEHGKGLRSEYVPGYLGDIYPLVEAVKAAFDGRNQLNPGKVATPGHGRLARLDEVPTRGQADRQVPPPVRAEFEDAMHCNGNGACFDWNPDSVMCPSWKESRERRHSPKGRAMLVKEWLRRLAEAGADPVAEARRLRAQPLWHGWIGRLRNTLGKQPDFSHEVKEALDGCLSCKSCVGSCPIRVNVPNFRARFLEVYHGRYLRPAKDYMVSSLEHLMPMLARMPWAYNAIAGQKALMGWLGLVDSPTIKGRPWAAPLSGGRPVIIVQDAFTSYYETQLVQDVLELLRRIGFQPTLAPFRPNGKAMHVHGFLKAFEQTAAKNAAHLSALAAQGVPLVGIDPAMTLTYRAEYAETLGVDRAPPVQLLQEWLAEVAPQRPKSGRAPYRLLPHCTEKTTAPGAMKAWTATFARFGLDLEILQVGCCGMAGTYGHEARHRDASHRIYQSSWEPHVDQGGQLVAAGYSCRSQIKRFSDKYVPHPVQALLAEV